VSQDEAIFEPLSPLPAYRRVSNTIEQKILRRGLRPGDTLPTETELARQFAVNRSTVREALRQLESQGLVGRVAGGKRLVVTRPAQSATASQMRHTLALDDVRFIELWEAMLAIAPRTAALSAAHAAEADHAPLEQAIAAVEAARSTDAVVSGVADFFGRLAALSGNRVLMLAMEPVTDLLTPSLRRMIDRVPHGRDRILIAQRCILEAIRQAKPEEAEAWMRRHVEDFRRGYELAGISLDTQVGAPRNRG